MKQSTLNETQKNETENTSDGKEISNNVLDFSSTLQELRKTVAPNLIRQRAGRRDQNGNMHVIEYV